MSDTTLYKMQDGSETLTTATIESITFPDGARELLIKLDDDTVAWEISPNDSTMANPINVAADGTFVALGPFVDCTVYVRQSSGGDVTATYAYAIPVSM